MYIYDSDIRKLLFAEFLNINDFTSDLTTKIIAEMDVCFGTSRIDLAVINGKLHGFEIKSERDNLERLSEQIESYNKVFDTLTIVIAENHISKIEGLVPEWWGIYCVSKDNGQPILIKERECKINKEVDILSIVQFLWREELIELLNKKGTKSKTRFALCEIVAATMEETIIKTYVRQKLKSRSTWRAVPLQQLCDDWLQ